MSVTSSGSTSSSSCAITPIDGLLSDFQSNLTPRSSDTTFSALSKVETFSFRFKSDVELKFAAVTIPVKLPFPLTATETPSQVRLEEPVKIPAELFN